MKIGDTSVAPPAAEMSLARSVIAPVRVLKLVTPPEASAAMTNAVVASWPVDVAGAAVGPVGTPVKAGEAIGAPPAPVRSAVVRTTLPARPLKVSTPTPPIAAATNAVVASCPLVVPGAAVGPCGVPVKTGDTVRAPPAPVMSAPLKVTMPVRVLNEATPAVLSATAFSTNAVVANWPVELPGGAVGPDGKPVNCGLSIGAKSVDAAISALTKAHVAT